jgi:hypothetical protein
VPTRAHPGPYPATPAPGLDRAVGSVCAGPIGDLGGSPANYVIKPGEKLAIIVDMTIPARTSVTVTGLWMGITNGILAGGPHGPVLMAPILVAQPRTSLGPGAYTFTLHWVAPAGLRPGGGRQLSTELAWPDGSVEREIAVFNVQGGSLGYEGLARANDRD